MDYPQLNLIFSLALNFTLMVGIGLRVLLSKLELPLWMSFLSWMALALSIFSALYIEVLFLRLMIPAFNRQIVLGMLLIGGIVARSPRGNIAGEYRRVPPVFYSGRRCLPAWSAWCSPLDCIEVSYQSRKVKLNK